MVNRYTGDPLMHTFLKKIQQGIRYYSQIASYQEELRREERIINQKSLSISDLQRDYLNLNNPVKKNEREFFAQSR